jgi:putative RNA 2'-phosphotransferase
MNHEDLSKAISHALRHEPWIYELELDDEGWASLDALLAALRERGDEWQQLTREDVERMIASSAKRRHELVGGRIRALYGHSLPGKLQRKPGVPPAILFHGTSPEVAAKVFLEGLKPMSRQYVHLSVDAETALEVGRRKSPKPVLLRVDAKEAHENGVVFYVGNEKVWLADAVPGRFLRRTP